MGRLIAGQLERTSRFVFQQYFALSELTLRRNLAFPVSAQTILASTIFRDFRAHKREWRMVCLRIAHKLRQQGDAASGGEYCRRVSIGRALVRARLQVSAHHSRCASPCTFARAKLRYGAAASRSSAIQSGSSDATLLYVTSRPDRGDDDRRRRGAWLTYGRLVPPVRHRRAKSTRSPVSIYVSRAPSADAPFNTSGISSARRRTDARRRIGLRPDAHPLSAKARRRASDASSSSANQTAIT